MKPFAVIALSAVLLIAAVLVVHPASAQPGRSGKIEVRHVEIATDLRDGDVRARFHTVSGLAVDYVVKSDQAAESLLQMVDTFANRGVRMLVEIDDGKVIAVHLEVGR